MEKLACLCTITIDCRKVVHVEEQRQEVHSVENRRYPRISVLQDETLSVSGNVDGDRRVSVASYMVRKAKGC